MVKINWKQAAQLSMFFLGFALAFFGLMEYMKCTSDCFVKLLLTFAGVIVVIIAFSMIEL